MAASLQNNKAGEDPLRQVSVYLPPGNEQGTQRYLVIYTLHAFEGRISNELFPFFNTYLNFSLTSTLFNK